ncbi:MAG: hypothetical protein ACK5CA_04810 [Cyanobacteriota bacterium]|jgi:hypothetical protein
MTPSPQTVALACALLELDNPWDLAALQQSYQSQTQDLQLPERQPLKFILLSAAYALLTQHLGISSSRPAPLTPLILQSFQVSTRLEKSFATVFAHYQGDRQEIESVLRRNIYACVYACHSPKALKQALRQPIQQQFQSFHQHLQQYLSAVLDHTLEREERFFSGLFQGFYRQRRRRWQQTLYRHPCLYLYVLANIAVGLGAETLWGYWPGFPSPLHLYGLLAALLTLVLALYLWADYRRYQAPPYFLTPQLTFPGYQLRPPTLPAPPWRLRSLRWFCWGLSAALGAWLLPPWGALSGLILGGMVGQAVPLYSVWDLSAAKTQIYQQLTADLSLYLRELDQEIKAQLWECQQAQIQAIEKFLALHLERVMVAFQDPVLIRRLFSQSEPAPVSPTTPPSLAPPQTKRYAPPKVETGKLVEVKILDYLRTQETATLADLQSALAVDVSLLKACLLNLETEGFIKLQETNDFGEAVYSLLF